MLAWLAAASLLGILGAWNQRLAAEQATSDVDPAARRGDRAHRAPAGPLVTDVHRSRRARQRDAGLDLLAADVPSIRSAVLVTQDAEHLVPVALRGSTRAPWAVADHVSGVLTAVRRSGHRREVTFADDLGARRALVVPCALGNGSTTVLVAERPESAGSSPRRSGGSPPTSPDGSHPTIQAGLLFGSCARSRASRSATASRATSTTASLRSWRPSATRSTPCGCRPDPPESDMRDGLDALRDQLGEVMADLRLHITDLRVAERPGTGLGRCWAPRSRASGA